MNAVGDGGSGQPSQRHPLGACGDAQFDELQVGVLDGLRHATFIAASSLSKIPKIFTSPVISKIFLICGLVQTRFTDPPCSRTRLSPPINTPNPVESM